MKRNNAKKTKIYTKGSLFVKIEWFSASQKMIYIDPKRPEIGFKGAYLMVVHEKLSPKSQDMRLLASKVFDEKPKKVQEKHVLERALVIQADIQSRDLVQSTLDLLQESGYKPSEDSDSLESIISK